MSESDTDQSACSQRRSASPVKTPGQKTKSRKKRERKKVDALTNGLDVLLGSTFQEATGSENAAVIRDKKARDDGDEEMEIENSGEGEKKKMNKRTRENLRKMELRRQQKLALKAKSVSQPLAPPSQHVPAKRPDAKKATTARRARKQRARATKREEKGNRMDIG